MKVYRCEDTIDSIFTGIYDAWASGCGHSNVRLEVIGTEGELYNLELFAEYIMVAADGEKAGKVARSIKRKISEEAFLMVTHAAISFFPDKADAIYRFLILAFQKGQSVISQLGNQEVMKLFEINRYVKNEVHYFTGFLRFEEADTNLLVAKYEPKSNITEALMPHFAERFPDENMIILDLLRNCAAIHEAGNGWYMSYLSKEQMTYLMNRSTDEAAYQSMWKIFFKSISIEARENKKLQRNMLRLHYRKHMTEFQ